MTNRELAAKAEHFLQLHSLTNPLILCNVWDAASARIVESAGYPALATTSSGIANSLGYADGEKAPVEEMMEAVRRISRCVSVPLSADLEAGYGDVERATQLALDAGAIGLNFEDFADGKLAPIKEQQEQIRAIRKVGDSRGVHLVINARTDIYLAQIGEEATRFEAAVERALAYGEAGADCIFVPFALTEHAIQALVNAIPLPLNVLAVKGCPSISWLSIAGVKRVSLGGGPMRACMGLTRKIAESILQRDGYEVFADLVFPAKEANALFVS